MNQRITQETFRFKFLNYNRTWLINQLPSILTARTLKRSRPYLINQFTVLINKARGTQCELCLSRKQLNVECVVPLETLAEKFDMEHPEDEFDQVAWKTFWIRHQRYKTICLACITAEKEKERGQALKAIGFGGPGGGGGGDDDDDFGDDDGNDWGPVYLTAASRAILVKWYKTAQERVFGKGGKKRKQVVVDVSDDEGDEAPSQWARTPVDLSAASTALAVRWLRTARVRIQKANAGGEVVVRRKKPTAGGRSKNKRK
eukprot:CAMPEP_0171891194 /NCGR_PEP_ID=MMETSP0992-20121227/44597_1 /TAXON_ID=483369 /ORGANISM="non described non described, Strain CCMP2098" /LENGTH=258 /DNA_ID=CAMNT_0012518489 /DNA_START=14 /DNA_END=791 /DNA_ORIENTATION=-